MANIAGNTGAASSSYIPDGTGAASRTIVSKLNERVSVTDFGAVGDGVTDDTAAIQAAIDFGKQLTFPAGTRAIFVPNGRYRLDSTLTVYDHTKLVGEGPIDTGTEFWFYGGATANCMESVAPDSTEKSMFWMEGIRVKDKRTSPTAGSGLRLSNFVNGTRLLRCEISNFPDYNFHFTAPIGAACDRLSVINSWFSAEVGDSTTANIRIERLANNASIENCYFDHIEVGSIGVQIVENTNKVLGTINVSNCSFETSANTTGASIEIGESHGSVCLQNIGQTTSGNTGAHIVSVLDGVDGQVTLINVHGEKHNAWGVAPHTLNVVSPVRYVDGRIGHCELVPVGHPIRVGLGGSGTPESSFFGSTGEIYHNYAGGVNTTLYVKESGDMTNTGWVAK